MSKAILIEKPAGVVQGDMGYFDAAGKFVKVGGTLGIGKVPVRQADNSIQWATIGGGVPDDGSVTNAKVAAGAAIAETKLALASDAAAGTASRRTLGTGATQAAAGNHAHTAVQIAATPFGSIAANTVEGQLQEIVSEAVGGGISQATADALYRRRLFPNVASPSQDMQGMIATAAAPGALAMRGHRITMPKDGNLANLWLWFNGNAGPPIPHIIAAIYDVGATTSGVRTKIWESAQWAPSGVTVDWVPIPIATGTPGTFAVTAGQILEFSFLNELAAPTIGRGTSVSGATFFPDAVGMVNGCKPKLTWAGPSPGSFVSPPATLAEADLTAATNWWPMFATYA
jgi:hypothetical protein